MNDQLRSDLIAYKMRAAKDLLPEIKSHIDNGFYNTAMNRMYYACFNAATALLIAEKVPEVKRHSTVRNLFNRQFVKTGRFDAKWGNFYSEIMDCRAAADYEDFKIYTHAEAAEMYPHVCEFVALAEDELNKINL